MIVVDNAFNIGDTVYLKTDPGQYPRIVTHVVIYNGGECMYGLVCGNDKTQHYGFEITREINEEILGRFTMGDD